MNRHRLDFAIVGAGMVGMAQAALLAVRHPGMRLALLEASPETTPQLSPQYEPRVVALTQASRELLEEVGAWDDIASRRACPYVEMRVWDADGTGSVSFNSRDVQLPNLGHIVENNVIVAALRARLETLPNVELVNGFRLESWWRDCGLWHLQPRGEDRLNEEDGLREQPEIVRTRLLIGADGARSKVRDLLHIRSQDTDYHQTALVCVARSEKSHRHTAWQRFLQTGPLAFLPLAGLGDDNHCAVVWSADEELAQELLMLDDQAFALNLEKAFESRLGKVESVSERFSFPLRARHAERYRGPGAVLVGDAAHSIHPLAGQGVNLGLQDVRVLADEIDRAMARGLEPSHSSVLARYERRRRGDNAATMKAMSAFKSLFGAGDVHWRWLRNTGLSMVDASPMLKKRIIMRAMAV
ncbi:UbiH/UbiF/VisC/COQ6 family ubiquinone biosynthesis hydroxylase [Microbulbifer sp. VAAF005]|uniref:UbiH/UbiF/VisC/COQ6 family ubiquinone biosynthesis hydroxylase n=1 Tax=unclassified Microbulbifer TaxID=2619833 RepID=UPI0024ADB3F3|nr:UbiH/UbiF/VisC/COQ6 family ubiquinone biosynthesis hydroxylase [Microbulbifer sp. VAAF005]WHI45242.1 UbiH/UbiF/VisC/COQ6 family ubiquinone biosynthesis hydroxylase [Microbulbifer sp. VAAF005]